MTFEEPEVLLLERSRSMMLLLAPHIAPELLKLRLTDGECPVTHLPLEPFGELSLKGKPHPVAVHAPRSRNAFRTPAA